MERLFGKTPSKRTSFHRLKKMVLCLVPLNLQIAIPESGADRMPIVKKF
jgi:hypothetical protein